MGLIYLIQKELYAAWFEATNPQFPANSANDFFYTDQSNYYHSLKGKVIDTNSGESLFQQQPTASISTKAQRQNLSEAGSVERKWKNA